MVSALATSAIAGGVAWASIPGDGSVIQGCYDSGGNLKVVAGLPCPKGYTALAWNQQGPKGEKGDPGPAGKDGLNGTNGTNGADDQDGQDGVSVTGESEPAGANCAEGGSKFTAANGTTYACNRAPGSAGTGPPQAYTKTDFGDITFGGSSSAGVVIIARSVPAGSYVVHGTVAVYNTGSSVNTAYCRGGAGHERADPERLR